MPFTVNQIDHVEVFVSDIEASIRWYNRVLGLEVIRRWDPHPVMIGAGGTMLALFQGDADATSAPSSSTRSPLRWRLVAWRISPDQFGEAQEHLRQCSVEFDGPIDHDGPRSIYFTDPDGHALEITCYPSAKTFGQANIEMNATTA